MWIASKYGFFSTVRVFIDREPRDLVYIRSPREEHLQRLKERFPKKIGDKEITRNPVPEHLFQMLISLADWASMSAHIAAEIHYPDLKSEVRKSFGFSDEYPAAMDRASVLFKSIEPPLTEFERDFLDFLPAADESRGTDRGDH